jgi:hypothetical protein
MQRLHGLGVCGGVTLFLWLCALAAPAGELYVAPDGDDANAGTETKPLATIQGARDAVRALIGDGLQEDVTVWFRGGTYRLEETVVFGLDDSAPKGRTISYAAYEGEEPVFTSTRSIAGWRKLDDPPEALPEAARGKVWVADVPNTPDDPWRFRTLYDGETRLPRARSRGFSATSKRIDRDRRWTDLDTLRFPEGALRAWENLEDVEILIRPNHVWVVNYLPLASVDESAKVAKTAVPATYNLNPSSGGGRTPHVWVENVLEALDTPGEWVLNTREGKLYLWPPNEAPGKNIAAPRLRELIRVEGKNVDALEGDVPVRGLHFRGLALTGGDRDVWTAGDKGIQHDWEMWDKDNALIRFRGAADCSVEDCILRNSGGSGIRLDRYAQGIRLAGNDLHNLGGTGILLCGYGPGLKDVNKGNEIVDNHIRKCGQLHLHNPGIFIWQSGENKVLNNRLHDFPYDAIVLSGVRPRYFDITDPVKWKTKGVIPKTVRENMLTIRWEECGKPKTAAEARRFAHARDNRVQDNEVHDAMQLLGDGNAIYLSCAGEGNVVRRNLVYNCPRAGSQIRFDDDQELSTVEENVVIGPGLTLKHTNFVLNNVFIGGAIRIKKEAAPGCKIERNIFLAEGDKADFYDTNAKLLQQVEPDRNLFHGAGTKAGRDFLAKVRELGYEEHGVFADPEFVDLERFDVRLKPDSPARKIGIQSIDIEKIGLLDDPAFPRVREQGLISTATSGGLLGPPSKERH